MALQKKIELNNGIVANYHVINQVHFNFLENKTLISLDSYVSKEIRDSHKKIDEVNKSIISLTEQAGKAEKDGNLELLESLNEKISSLVAQFQDLASKNYTVGTSSIALSYIPEDISLTGLYKVLTSMTEYSKAKKV